MAATRLPGLGWVLRNSGEVGWPSDSVEYNSHASLSGDDDVPKLASLGDCEVLVCLFSVCLAL